MLNQQFRLHLGNFVRNASIFPVICSLRGSFLVIGAGGEGSVTGVEVSLN